LILTDIRMPFMNGLELASRLRENEQDICTIIISGHDEFEYAKAAIKLSVFDYILKPIILSELNDVIRRATQWIKDNPRKRGDELTSSKYPNEINIAEQYIRKNFMEVSLDLNSVANYVNLNPCYFSTLFKKKTNSSFINFLTNLRIEKAKHLLKNTSMRTYEVAYEIGYDNPSYFSTVFKKITGLTPKEYKDTT